MSNTLPLLDNITIYEGDDTTLTFTCSSDITGYKVELNAELGKDSPYTILKVIGYVHSTDPTKYVVPIRRSDTIGKGRTEPYPYDIKLTSPAGSVRTDRYGDLTIIPDAGGDGDSSTTSGDYRDFIETDGLTDNAILKWDATTNMLKASGVTSDAEGDLTTATNSVNIGVHDVGSAGRQIAITNRADGRTFNPVMQEVGVDDARTTPAYQREHEGMTELEFGAVTPPDDYVVLTNPVWNIITSFNETVFGIELHPVQNMTNVIYTIKENGVPIYTANIGDFRSANPPSFVYFETPFSLYENKGYSVTLTCEDGSDAMFYGDPLGRPHYTVKLKKFNFKELATKEYVDAQPSAPGSSLDIKKDNVDVVPDARHLNFVGDFTVTPNPNNATQVDVEFTGDITGAEVFTDLTDTPNTYGSPRNLVRINEEGNALEFVDNTLVSLLTDVNITNPQDGDVLTFTGTEWQNEVPLNNIHVTSFLTVGSVGQVEDYSSNILWVQNGQETVLTLPTVREGNFLWVINKNDDLLKTVTLNAKPNTTIANSGSYTVNAYTQTIFMWDEDTAEWKLVFEESIAPPEAPEIPEVPLKDPLEVVHISANGVIGSVSSETSTYLTSTAETATNITLPVVDSSDINPFFWVKNYGLSASAEIQLNSPNAASVDNSTFSVVPPNTESMYRYEGGNWALLFEKTIKEDTELLVPVYSDKNTLLGEAKGFAFPNSNVTLETDGVAVVETPSSISFYQTDTGTTPVVSSDKVAFSNAGIFIGQDGRAIVDTSASVEDSDGNIASEVISFKFEDCTVEQQDIPNRDAKVAVVIPKVNSKTAEPVHGAALLAYVGNRQQINTAYAVPPALEQTNIYFDDIAWNNSALVTYDETSHSYTMSPRNGEPTVYFVSATVNFKSDEVDSYGYVRLYANDDSANLGEYPVVTTNSGLLASQVYYRDSEKVGTVIVEGFVEVKNPKEISFHVVDSLTKEMLYLEDRNVLPSAVLIQEMRQGFRTSPAFQQYCSDYQRDIRVSHLDLSKPSSLDWITGFNVPVKTLPAGNKGSLHAGEVFHTLNKLNLEIANDAIHFQSFDGTNPMDFVFGNVLTNDQTAGLRGKDVQMDISTKISNVGVLTQVMMVVWKGEADKWTHDVYTSRDPQTKDPIFAPNWSLGGQYSDNNDDTPDYKLHTNTFTVPLDAVNVGFVFLIKNTLQDAFGDIYINRFDITTNPALTTDVFHDPLFHGNNAQYTDDESMVFSLNSHGYASLVYNLGTTPVPTPLGYITQGGAPVIIDRTENVNTSVQFQDAYGALSFPEEAIVTLDASFQIYNSTPTVNTVNFQWYVKHGSSGTEEPISETLSIFPQIEPDISVGTTLTMKPLTYGVKAGDLLYLKGWSNIEGGAYLESAPRLGNNKPMVVVKMDYKHLLPPPEAVIPKGDVLRVFFKTLDNQPAAQTINNVNEAATVIFNDIDLQSDRVTIDLSSGHSGVFTFVDTTPAIVTAGFNVIRNVDPTPQGVPFHWGIFMETSVDGGTTWTKVPQTTVVETFPSTEGRQVKPVLFSFPVAPTVPGTKVRFEFFADNADVIIVALPENYYGAQEPASAGAMFSVYSVA
ncbi:putative L-shaped tail fiber protein [Vibrio phage PhiImVa-1]|nr:putative L-shaped tail fiber protein [Vibrio phage PhiImVa-1]